jgi:hypothetical protein
MKVLETIAVNKLVIAVTFVGALAAAGWPLIHHFITGEYDENIVLDLDFEKVKVDDAKQLLVIHVKPTNRGSVPVQISGDRKRGAFEVEVRSVGNLPDLQWIEPDKLATVKKANILRQHPTGYSIESNAAYEEIEAITLPMGLYWVNAKMTFDDGDYVDQSALVKLSADKPITE